MAKGHITRKELRKDAVQDAGRSLLAYLGAHSNQILAGALAVVVLVLGVRVGFAIAKGRRENAARMLVRARQQVITAEVTTDPAQRAELLDSAIRRCDELRSKYPSLDAGIEAFYVKGDSYFQRREFDQAISLYQNYVAQARGANDKAKGYVAIAFAYENRYFLAPTNKDLLNQAMDYYERAQKQATSSNGKRSYLAYQALMELARLYRLKGETNKAVDTYKTIVKERPFYEAEEAKETGKKAAKETSEETGRDEQVKAIRKEIREAQGRFSFESGARTALENLGVSTDAASSQSKTN